MKTYRKKTDDIVRLIIATLKEKYGAKHARAQIEAYRYNPASVRIRITDPDFAGKNLVEREKILWPIIESLPDEIQSEISILLLLTPQERKTSFGSMEFDDPSRMRS